VSAEIIRRAVALIRERAEAATPGPWMRGDLDRFGEGSYTVDYTDVEPNVCGGIDPADAEHIASWHPAAALACADMLEIIADGLDVNPYYDFPPAEDFARAYLGEGHDA